MSDRALRRLVWALLALAVALHAAGFVFVALGIGIGTPGDEELTIAAGGFLIAFYAFPLVGAVIASRRPDNAIGWLFLAIGIVLGADNLASSYADFAIFAKPGALPGGEWAGWAVSWLDPLFFFGVVLLVLLFPSGRPPSPRWRPVIWMLSLSVTGTCVVSALRPGPIFEQTLPIANPAAIEGADTLLDVVDAVSVALYAPAALITIGGVVLRFRRARGVERLQFKWFAASATLLFVSFASFFLVPLGLPDGIAVGLVGFAFAGIALAVGAAVLRYRLYEIDRVVSRAVAYGTLTALLVALYVGLVLAGQALFSSFAGGGDLAIAVSTLVVAALFLPARSRIQALVDRRFNRRSYDAQRTLESFGARLREQVELETLTGDLRRAVDETMRPAHVSLWLRGEAR